MATTSRNTRITDQRLTQLLAEGVVSEGEAADIHLLRQHADAQTGSAQKAQPASPTAPAVN